MTKYFIIIYLHYFCCFQVLEKNYAGHKYNYKYVLLYYYVFVCLWTKLLNIKMFSRRYVIIILTFINNCCYKYNMHIPLIL